MSRPYPPEFRRRGLDLVESGRSVRDVAASLGIAESCLHRWRHRDLVDRGLKPGVTVQESAELAARQRIRDLEEEVKILRKAAVAVEAVVPPKNRYHLVAELHAEGVRTGRSCHALRVSREVRAWQARPLDPVWAVVFLDAIFVKVRDNHVVQNKPAYIAIGVDADGEKHVLGIWLARTPLEIATDRESARFWASVTADLRNRGVRDILIACCATRAATYKIRRCPEPLDCRA